MKTNKQNILITVPIIFSFLILTFCRNNKYYASPEEAIQANIDYMNTENFDGVMSTIHPDSPFYKTTKNMVKQLFKIYDLNYKIEYLKVLDDNNEEATVEFTQLTTKINGPQFKNNRIKGRHILKKDGDSWKIYSTEVLNTEFIN